MIPQESPYTTAWTISCEVPDGEFQAELECEIVSTTKLVPLQLFCEIPSLMDTNSDIKRQNNTTKLFCRFTKVGKRDKTDN